MREAYVDTLTTLDLIAKPAKDLYMFPGAVEACQAAIGKSETLGPHHPSSLLGMAILGITNRPMGLLDEAKRIGMHAVERRREILGNTHPDTFSSMSYVETVVRALGDYDTAMKLETGKFQGWTES